MNSRVVWKPLAALALASALASASDAQIWDKYLAPGFTYRMEVDLSVPRILHAIRFTPQSAKVTANPEVGGLKVYAEDSTRSRQTISELVKSTGAIGGINGDFFPYTGDPLGLMVRNGELLSAPYPKRSVFAWSKLGAMAGTATLTLGARNGSLGTFPMSGLNQECGLNEIVVNTPSAGWAIGKPNSVHVVLKGQGDWGPKGKWQGTVERIERTDRLAVPDGGVVLTGTGPKSDTLAALRMGDPIAIEVSANGFDWTKYDQAVGGGPTLVRNGQVAVDWEYQGFTPSFATRRHPRSAVGITRSGDIWFVAVDGRQKLSDGATLDEMGRIMKRFGCVDAVNLDGGGSTTINLFGVTLNRPSDGRENRVANGVLFFGPAPKPSDAPMKISGPDMISLGQGAELSLWEGAAKRPNANVIWKAGGAGWIDQGGMVRPTDLGKVYVVAWCNGRQITKEIAVVEKPKPPAKKAPSKKKPPRKKGKG